MKDKKLNYIVAPVDGVFTNSTISGFSFIERLKVLLFGKVTMKELRISGGTLHLNGVTLKQLKTA